MVFWNKKEGIKRYDLSDIAEPGKVSELLERDRAFVVCGVNPGLVEKTYQTGEKLVDALEKEDIRDKVFIKKEDGGPHRYFSLVRNDYKASRRGIYFMHHLIDSFEEGDFDVPFAYEHASAISYLVADPTLKVVRDGTSIGEGRLNFFKSFRRAKDKSQEVRCKLNPHSDNVPAVFLKSDGEPLQIMWDLKWTDPKLKEDEALVVGPGIRHRARDKSRRPRYSITFD